MDNTDPIRKCADCSEHSGVKTLLDIHSEYFKLFEKRFSQVFIGLFLCLITGIIGVLVAAHTPSQGIASASESESKNPGLTELREKFRGVMDTLTLHRKESSSKGTLGVLSINDRLFGFTLEPPKAGNRRGVSCIPTGSYVIQKYFSEKFQRVCFKLFDVDGREYISMHNGNYCRDTKGCILVGRSIGEKNGKREVQYSRQALDGLVNALADTSYLTIKEEF